MSRERWQRISETFNAALEQPPDERDSFLGQVCAGDGDLKLEVVRLLAEFETAGDFLETPLIAPVQTVEAGDMVAGRYRIEGLLGRGGMGEVYRAHDELMGEPIALKMLRPELIGNPRILRRFQREVQLARKVTHPNVCRVFDVGVHAPEDRAVHFFTMELLNGETLSSRIRRAGRLGKQEAFPLIVQMAEGLHAAHQAGVIHRDFKSSNVILCDGRAVITDFGLARFEPAEGPVETAGTITSNAQIAGTVAYMSPEQLSGGEVTTASDIYSFGVVLFEMATGRLPFDDRHIIQSAMQRASATGADVRALAPKLDRRWTSAITRCLQGDPAERFPTASAVASHIAPPTWRPQMAYWTRRDWLRGGAAAGAAVSAVALIPFASRFTSQDATLPEGAEALLIPIANSTGDARFEGITELFRSQLSQSVHLNLIDRGALSGVLSQMGQPEDSDDPAAIREAAWRSNAALWISGTISRVGTDYALSVQVETRGSQPDNPRTKLLRSFSATDPSALMNSVREAALWIRETVGESAAQIASFDRLPADVTTPSWEALTYYARGQQHFMQQDFEPAILEFEAALREDPKFTLAALRRADLLISQGRQTDGFPQWRAAIVMLGERPVTRAEELNARGMFALDSGDIDTADRYFRTWSVEYPHDWRAPFYRMLPLVLNGHTTQALELLERLRRTMPDYGDIYAQMISCHLVLGQVEHARELIPEVRKRNRTERADMREAYCRFREGDCVGYLEMLRSIERSSSYRRGAADAMLQEALLLIDAGYPEATVTNVEDFLSSGSWVETLPEQVSLRIVQAWAEMLTGRNEVAVRHARQALDIETGPMIVALAGSIFARADDANLTERALSLCTGDLLEFPYYRIARCRILGERAKARDQREEAVNQFRSASALEPRIAHRQYLIEALPASSPERLDLALNVVRIPWQVLRPPPLHCLGSLSIAVSTVNAVADEPFAKRFAESRRQIANQVQRR